MADIIDGKAIARQLDDRTKAEVDALVVAGKPRPGLTVILVGDDGASQVYVRRKIKGCEKVGIRSSEHRLPADTSQENLLALIDQLNNDPEVHGILCQVPLPQHIDTRTVLGAISPEKDVDGFHPVNVGRLSTGTGGIVPCTPLGVMMLLETVIDDFVGKDAVVIGKSNIVGKPVAMLLLERECTVTVTHIYTENLPEIARKADIIVAAAGAPELVQDDWVKPRAVRIHGGITRRIGGAAGEPELVKGDWVKPGAVVIDVGITRIMGDDGKEKLVGDVKFDEVQHAKAVTPVPGGVGPMTIAVLLHNTVQAAKALSNGAGEDADPYHDAPDRSLIYGTAEGPQAS